MKKLKSGIYKASNVTFDPKTMVATSYIWWHFVKVIEGKVIFNDYRYSPTTGRHQTKVRRLMQELGIKIDITLPIPKGLQAAATLEELILEAEEHLCEDYLRDVVKKQDNYLRTKAQRLTRKQAYDSVPDNQPAVITYPKLSLVKEA